MNKQGLIDSELPEQALAPAALPEAEAPVAAEIGRASCRERV